MNTFQDSILFFWTRIIPTPAITARSFVGKFYMKLFSPEITGPVCRRLSQEWTTSCKAIRQALRFSG